MATSRQLSPTAQKISYERRLVGGQHGDGEGRKHHERDEAGKSIDDDAHQRVGGRNMVAAQPDDASGVAADHGGQDLAGALADKPRLHAGAGRQRMSELAENPAPAQGRHHSLEPEQSQDRERRGPRGSRQSIGELVPAELGPKNPADKHNHQNLEDE
jgi:hypothetical protein